MKRGIVMRVVALACGLALAVGCLSGCAAQNNEKDDQQAANRQYMSLVSQSIDSLSDRLDSFEDAVSRGDVVAMKTQADNAFKALDSLAAIEAPEALKDIRESYIEGCSELEDALSAYIDLYVEIDSATEEHPFDYSTYSDRVKSIQDQYNKGIAALAAADKKATEAE